MNCSNPLHIQRLIILFTCFMTGLVLVIQPFDRVWEGSLKQPALLAPVASPNSPDRDALEHRPLPLPGVQLPEEVSVCMEPGGERVDLLGTVQDRGKTFYLLAVYSDFANSDPLNTADNLIALDPSSGCIRLIDSQSVHKPLPLYLSYQAAQVLEQQRFRRDAALLGGMKQLQQKLEERITAAKGNYLLSAEQVEALRQLPVQIPASFKLLRPDTFPD
jgi:hypothetical protein